MYCIVFEYYDCTDFVAFAFNLITAPKRERGKREFPSFLGSVCFVVDHTISAELFTLPLPPLGLGLKTKKSISTVVAYLYYGTVLSAKHLFTHLYLASLLENTTPENLVFISQILNDWSEWQKQKNAHVDRPFLIRCVIGGSPIASHAVNEWMPSINHQQHILFLLHPSALLWWDNNIEPFCIGTNHQINEPLIHSDCTVR